MGGSEAKAIELTESKMRLSHSKCNPVRRHRMLMQEQIAFSSKIAVLTVSWDCGNPCIELSTFLLHVATATMQGLGT